MFILKNVFRQAILDDGGEAGGGEEAATPSTDILDDNAEVNANSQQMNVEHFLSGFDAEHKESAQRYANKFADDKGNLNVANMIKSGYSLEAKFGGFTGAPESYEIKTPDYFEGDVNMEDPYLQEFQTMAKDANMSQDMFEKFMDVHLRASIAPQANIEDMQKEIGPEFNAMRSNMAGFFKQRLDDDTFKSLQGMITDTNSFKALYSVFKASKPTKIDDAVRENFNQAEMKDQMDAEYLATDTNGNPKMRDPVYAKSWRTRWEPFINQSDM